MDDVQEACDNTSHLMRMAQNRNLGKGGVKAYKNYDGLKSIIAIKDTYRPVTGIANLGGRV